MEMTCDRCGRKLWTTETEDASIPTACPACVASHILGEDLETDRTAPGRAGPDMLATNPLGRTVSPTSVRGDERNRADYPVTSGPATLFQPGIMVESILAADDQVDPAGARAAAQPGGGTEVLADTKGMTPPPLGADVEAYFLIAGAPDGRERRPLPSAITVVGRKGDVAIDEPAASERHFKVEAMGREFYIRDLESRNGTYVNGRKIRYCQLLPGDEVRIGRAVLIFRVAGDGLSTL